MLSDTLRPLRKLVVVPEGLNAPYGARSFLTVSFITMGARSYMNVLMHLMVLRAFWPISNAKLWGDLVKS